MIKIDIPMPTCCNECFALDDMGDYPACLISHDVRGYTFNTRTQRMPSCPLIDDTTPSFKDFITAMKEGMCFDKN